jgi:hypothetical protein
MTLEMDSGEKEDVLRARHLTTLADAIFTVWFGAFAENIEDRDDLGGRCHQSRNLPYSRCSSHNPLTKDIMIPRDDLITARINDTNGVQEHEPPDLVWYTDWFRRDLKPLLLWTEQEGEMPPFGVQVFTCGGECPSTTTKLR